MPIRANRYNDPALGEAFGSIAQIFAPPSAQEMAAYATAQAARDKNARLAQLFANPNDPNFDRLNVAVGNYAPSQSYYSVDQGNAVTRRGQDIAAQTSITNNAADNERALATNAADNQRATVTSMFTPLNPGQVRPAVPASIASQFGLPELPQTAGAPKPMSETEVAGEDRRRLQASGQLTDQMILDTIVGEKTPVQVVGPDGNPQFASPGAAVRTGARPYNNRGAEAAKKPVVLFDPTTKQQISGIFDPSSGTYTRADGSPAPEGAIPYNLGSPTGSNEQIGLGKPVTNNIEQQLTDVAIATDTAVKLRDMISSAPASQGAVGSLRGTAQNLLQTSGELGQYFGGVAQQANDAIRTGAADANLVGAFDPSLPAIEFLSNLLAFQHAKTTTGERLSNEMLRASRKALGLDGWTSNQADSLARLNTAIEQMNSQAATLKRIKSEGVGGVGSAPDAPVAKPIAAPASTGVDPALLQFMTPEEKALFQ